MDQNKITEKSYNNYYKRTYCGTTLMSMEKLDEDAYITQIRVIDGIPYLEKLKNNERISLYKLTISSSEMDILKEIV